MHKYTARHLSARRQLGLPIMQELSIPARPSTRPIARQPSCLDDRLRRTERFICFRLRILPDSNRRPDLPISGNAMTGWGSSGPAPAVRMLGRCEDSPCLAGGRLRLWLRTSDGLLPFTQHAEVVLFNLIRSGNHLLTFSIAKIYRPERTSAGLEARQSTKVIANSVECSMSGCQCKNRLHYVCDFSYCEEASRIRTKEIPAQRYRHAELVHHRPAIDRWANIITGLSRAG